MFFVKNFTENNLMVDVLRISDIMIKHADGFNELSGSLDGEHVYLRVSEQFKLYLNVEWLIGIALLEAMYRNKPLQIDSSVSVSKVFSDRLYEIQAIYACWNPDLSIVNIEATTCEENKQFSLVGCFFSAGVDSSHALIRNMVDTSHLLMFRGFDKGNDQSSWEQRVCSQEGFAASLGKKLIPIETNARQWTDNNKIAWEFAHGLLLSSVGGALGMKRVYVPSSHTYDELFPWGSHPLSDPMWSTESTEIIHDGAGFRRGAKMKDILREPKVGNNLQVCWRNIHQNCGECPKCVRTMAAVYLLGGNIDTLPPLSDLKKLKTLKAIDESGATFLEDAMVLAKEAKNLEAYNILKKLYRRYQIGQLWPLMDRYLLGGTIRRVYRKLRKPDWLSWRVTLRGATRWDI